MNIKKSLSSIVLAAFAMLSLNASAGNIDANAARAAANNFIKQQATVMPGAFRATAMTDLKLTHAEQSSAVQGAVDYYVFNIKGGGFVIVSGEDRAAQVIGYSDKGHLDVNNLPYGLQGLLNCYKEEIEFLQTYKGDDLVTVTPTFNATSGVEPLIKTTWGQEMPYYLQCPLENGEYCVVGCVATAMAQVMYYWKFPTSSAAISGYGGGWWGGVTVPALPATTFDYSLMLPSYCHWDYDLGELIQDTYTDEQAQEVAKLGRYCGQAVEMDYSPEGSGAYTSDQLAAMKSFGYSSSAQLKSKYGNTTQWETMIRTELDAGRPILYSASDPSAGGHAFICDGYNSSNYYHFNYGWYGTCDGWYLTTALNMIHRDGEELHFNSNHQMLTGVEPPTYCLIDAESLSASSGLMVLGQDINTEAQGVTFKTTYSTVNLMFSFVNQDGTRVCTSSTIPLSKSSFTQGSNVEGAITLPATLAEGKYDLQLLYSVTGNTRPNTIDCEGGQLTVVGRLAKYGEPFDINDITFVIEDVLKTGTLGLNINDITHLIDYVLRH